MIKDFDKELFLNAKKGDEKAQEEFIEKNKGLVHLVVKRFSGRGVDSDDLVQLGMIGLYKALLNFDLSYGVKFSTYAIPMIMGEIKRFLRDDGAVKVSRRLKELYTEIRYVKSELEKTLGRNPKITEISERLNVSCEEIVLSLSANDRVISLEEEINSEEKSLSLMDTVVDRSCDENKIIDRLVISELIGTLKQREKQIVFLRFFKELTQQKVAEMLGISQVQVCRLEKKILKNLRTLYTQ